MSADIRGEPGAAGHTGGEVSTIRQRLNGRISALKQRVNGRVDGDAPRPVADRCMADRVRCG